MGSELNPKKRTLRKGVSCRRIEELRQEALQLSKLFGEMILSRVLELREKGYTQREIGKLLGYRKEQISKLIERYNRKRREGTLSRSKGRPRTRVRTVAEERELRIKQLEREVELYRAFLQAAGRM